MSESQSASEISPRYGNGGSPSHFRCNNLRTSKSSTGSAGCGKGKGGGQSSSNHRRSQSQSSQFDHSYSNNGGGYSSSNQRSLSDGLSERIKNLSDKLSFRRSFEQGRMAEFKRNSNNSNLNFNNHNQGP